MGVRPLILARLLAVLVLVAAIPHVLWAFEVESSTGNAAEIGGKVVAFRQSLTSGVVEFDSSVGKSGSESQRTRYRVSFDGKKLRGTIIREYRGDWLRGEVYHESYAFPGNGSVLFYSNEKFTDGGILVATIRPDSQGSPSRPVPDPRLVGILPFDCANLSHGRLNSLFDNQEWRALRVQDDVIGQHQCLHTSYVRSDNDAPDAPATAEAWVDADRNWNVLRLIVRDSRAAVEERIDCELSLVGNVGWFPSSVRYERRKNGTVTREEDLRIRVLQFNEGLPEEAFTFAGMEIPVGHDVYDHTNSPSKHYKVRDGELVLADVAPNRQAPERAESSSVRRWILLVNGAIFGVVALWLFWRGSGRRRTRGSES